MLPPSATFTISTQQVPVSTQQQATVSPKAQPQPGNQAFSNLTSAAAKEAAKHGISPLSIALIIIILILGTAYVLQSRSAQPPAIDGPHINVTQLQQQEKNVTKPPLVPQKPAQNAAKTPSKNQTAPLPTNKTQPKAPNNTVQQNQTPLQQFSRYSRFFSSEGTPPSQFCQGRDAALYRVHYFQYSGSDCITGTGQGSYSSPLDFPYACDAIPCCYNSVSKEYSRLYDQFECGFYS